MSYAHYLKVLGSKNGGECDLSEHDAQLLFGAMLDGGVPELELGALLMALRCRMPRRCRWCCRAMAVRVTSRI